MNDPGESLQRVGAALRARDGDAVLACFASDATLGVESGRDRRAFTGEEIRDAIDTLLAGFDDIKLTPSARRLTTSGVVEESVLSGVHHGVFTDVQPTGARVHVNVHLSAVSGPDSTLQSLWVDVDAKALFAQIAGTDDIMGMTGGLVATMRERHGGPVRITDETTPAPSGAAVSGGRPSRRRWLAAVGLLLVVFLSWKGASTLGGGNVQAALPGTKPTTTKPSTKSVAPSPRTASPLPRTAAPRPTRPTPVSLPTIAISAPKAVPRVQAGKQVVLNSDVLFGFDSATLSPAATTTLNRLARQVRDARVTGTIQVNGYTDSGGSVSYDLALSRARALAVARVLQGALAGRPVTLLPQGFGPATPVALNTTEAGRSRNRRVTVVLPTPR